MTNFTKLATAAATLRASMLSLDEAGSYKTADGRTWDDLQDALSDLIARAPNVSALNAIIPDDHAVNGRRGRYSYLVRGQVMCSGDFESMKTAAGR